MSTETMQEETTNNQTETTQNQTLMGYIPPALYIIAGILMLASIAFPYWGMVLNAPQYPGGLEMRVFVNRMTGDEDPTLDEVWEIDGLNHYIGMKSLYDAAKIERAIALPAVGIMVILLAVAAIWNKRYSWLLTLPAIGFPFVFLGDLAFWMTTYGQNLDPYAPLSSAIAPFTPTVIGIGIVGQFSTEAAVDTGWYMAVGASGLIVIGLLLRASAYFKQPQG